MTGSQKWIQQFCTRQERTNHDLIREVDPSCRLVFTRPMIKEGRWTLACEAAGGWRQCDRICEHGAAWISWCKQLLSWWCKHYIGLLKHLATVYWSLIKWLIILGHVVALLDKWHFDGTCMMHQPKNILLGNIFFLKTRNSKGEVEITMLGSFRLSGSLYCSKTWYNQATWHMLWKVENCQKIIKIHLMYLDY